MLLPLKNDSEVFSEIQAAHEFQSSSLTANVTVGMKESVLHFLVLKD